MKRLSALGTALLIGGVVVGCTEGSIGPQGDGATRILLTDAPFPYDIVERVEIHVVSIAAAATADTSSGDQWITVAQPDEAFDLLALQRGTTALLGEHDLPADQYRAVRLVIDTDRSRLVRNDTAQGYVQWPVAGELALHALVEEPVDVSTDGATIVIDFDVGRSFHVVNDNHFIFLPWIRAVNQSRTGTLAGTVMSEATGAPVPNAAVAVYRGDPNQPDGTWGLAATGRSESDGRYLVSFLLPGTYIVRAEAPQSPTADLGTISGVTIAVGSETRADIALSERDLSGLGIFGPSSVEEGKSIQLQAVLIGMGGDSLNADVEWTNEDEDIVQLTPDGARAMVQGLAPGKVMIRATSGAEEDSLEITVIEMLELGSLVLSPGAQTLAIGNTGSVTASVTDLQGRTLPNVAVNWSVPDSIGLALLELDLQTIEFRADQPGTYTVQGTAGDKQAVAQVIVPES